jgi:hypothetical protein
VVVAGAAFIAVAYGPEIAYSMMAHYWGWEPPPPPPRRTPHEVEIVAQEKKIAEERSERATALRQNVEKRTVLCPGRTSGHVLSDMWKVVEARGLHPEPARFEDKPALEVTSEPSLWLRAYAEASGQAGSPVLLTVEVGAFSPEERRQYLESVLSAFSKDSGIPREELREVDAKSRQSAESPSP